MSNVCLACGEEHGISCPVVEQEIAIRKTRWGFIPQYWRKYRLQGLKPTEIDYDMCNVFR